MADRQNGLLVTLGKRLLGFTSSARSGATTEAKEPDARPAMKTIAVLTPDPKASGAGCCAPSCCSTDAPADGRRG